MVSQCAGCDSKKSEDERDDSQGSGCCTLLGAVALLSGHELLGAKVIVHDIHEVVKTLGHDCSLHLDLHHLLHVAQVLLHLRNELLYLLLFFHLRESQCVKDLLGCLYGQFDLSLHRVKVREHHVRVREAELLKLLYLPGVHLGHLHRAVVGLREPLQSSQVLKDADGLSADAVLAEDVVDVVPHGVHLLSQMCQFSELIEHVVQLVCGIDGRGGNLTRVYDHRLGPRKNREAQQSDEC